MAWPLPTSNRIATLRLRGGAVDVLAARRAIETALAPLDWQPRSVGAEAIVCVRRLRAALRSRDGARAAAWRDQVDALAAAAPRPWREAVPADAAAVVFDDESELLACLARDAVRGAGAAAWWWPLLLGEPAGIGALLRRWFAAPALLPTSLRRLVAHGEAGEVLAAVGEPQARRLGEAVATAFSIDGWGAADAPRAGTGTARVDEPTFAAATRHDALVAAVHAAVRSFVPAGAVATRRLLALALAVTEQPRLARAPGFARAVDDALRAEPPGRVERFAPAARAQGDAAAVPGAAPASIAAQREAAVASRAQPAECRPVQALPSVARVAGASPTPASPAAQHDARRRDRGVAPGDVPMPPVAPAPSSSPVTGARPLRGAARGPDHCADSAFAGTLYLLPIAVHLGWYGDFTQPLAPGLALHPADLLALLGEPLGGDGWHDDPLPALLAAWAGREPDELPGEGFAPPGGQPLGAWLAERRGEMARRAAAALLLPAGEALAWLCCRPGRVLLSDIALDAHFDLATHPIEIRLAGLDRDLGWLPAAGRRIAFHYGPGR